MTLLEEVSSAAAHEEVPTEEKTFVEVTPDLAEFFEVLFASEPLMPLGTADEQEEQVKFESCKEQEEEDAKKEEEEQKEGKEEEEEEEEEEEPAEEIVVVEVLQQDELAADEEKEENEEEAVEEDIACMPFLRTDHFAIDDYASLEAPPGLILTDDLDDIKVLQEENPDFIDTEDDGCSTPSSSDQPSLFMPARKVSDADFSDRDQSLIILDWDDTLCPSSYCMEVHHLYNAAQPPVGSEVEADLQHLAGKVQALFEKAERLAAHVAIVTNAGERWVDMSSTAWMPQLQPILATTSVSSARAKWEAFGISSPTGWKSQEFRHVIDEFYSRYDDQTWKNIICVGDAPYEHEALQHVLETGGQKSAFCRRKSMKFMIKPTIKQLAEQVERLTNQLEGIVAYDGGLEIDFGALVATEVASS